MKGILKINSLNFNILHFSNEIYTKADITGRPWSLPAGGVFSIVIAMQRNMGGMTRAALQDLLQVDGVVTFYQWDFSKIFSKLEFANAHIIRYTENYNHTGTQGPTVNVVFSPGIQRLNNEDLFIKPWNPSNPFEDAPVATEPPEEKELAGYSLTSIANIPVEDYNAGDTIVVNIATKNRVGDTTSIHLNDPKHNFKYNGELLENDTIQNIKITSDLVQVPLEVIAQEEEKEETPTI